jgi:NAD dependent epimerase/dehydratase family enzyme
MSWVSADDAAAACLHVLRREDVSGPVNVVAPHPVTNADFTRTLARVLRRPAFFRVPAALLRAVSRDMAEQTFLASQRVAPRRLLETGFAFQDLDLEPTLRRLLGAR